MKFVRYSAILLITGLAPLSAMAQHVHGVIELGVVVEKDTLGVSLSAPLSDIVGFEHAPENEDQERLIQEAATTLANPDEMFGLPGSARCEIADVSIEGPVYIERHLENDGGDGHDHDDEHDHDGDHHHGHDAHHDDAEHEEHAEVIASYEWQCGDVAALDSLELRFNQRFSSVESVQVQLLTSAGAQVLTIEGKVASVSLSAP